MDLWWLATANATTNLKKRKHKEVGERERGRWQYYSVRENQPHCNTTHVGTTRIKGMKDEEEGSWKVKHLD